MFPLAQLPVFMSMFFGLRRAAESFPVETATGGMLWFPDLSVADPTYALPLLTSGLFLVMIEVGADGMNASANKEQAKTMKNVMRGMGVLMVPFTYHFPRVFCYWVRPMLFHWVKQYSEQGSRRPRRWACPSCKLLKSAKADGAARRDGWSPGKAIETAKKQADDAPLVAADVCARKRRMMRF